MDVRLRADPGYPRHAWVTALVAGAAFLALYLWERPPDALLWLAEQPMILLLPVLAVAMPLTVTMRGQGSDGTTSFDTGTRQIRTDQARLGTFDEVKALLLRSGRDGHASVLLYMPARRMFARAPLVWRGSPDDEELAAIADLLAVPCLPATRQEVAATLTGLDERPPAYLLFLAACLAAIAIDQGIEAVGLLRSAGTGAPVWGDLVEAMLVGGLPTFFSADLALLAYRRTRGHASLAERIARAQESTAEGA